MIRTKENLSFGQKGRNVFVFGRAVCPLCVCELTSFHVTSPQVIDRHGITVRRYFGWCDGCGCGCEVEQFKVGRGRWFIHRWRAYSNDDKPIAGKWVLVRDMPVPVIMTGPGGDYDRPAFPADKFKQEYQCEFVGANG